MQKPVKRGDAWRITVRYLGKRYTATRDTASECEQWAAKKLLELQKGLYRQFVAFHSKT